MPQDEYDWIFDYVLQFLESDKFDAEIMNFVDEKCFVFEDDEENKFVYTDIHREFCDHVEGLMASNLGELGISNDMFLESCEKARSSRDINSTVFERLIAMEDFQTFKKIMTKRNAELQLEAMRSLRISSIKSRRNREEGKSGGEGKDEEDSLEKTFDASIASEASADGMSDDLMDPDLLRAYTEARNLGYDDLSQLEDEDLQDLLFQSLMEMEMIHRQEELEYAELERALTLSLFAEEERLRGVGDDIAAVRELAKDGSPRRAEQSPRSADTTSEAKSVSDYGKMDKLAKVGSNDRKSAKADSSSSYSSLVLNADSFSDPKPLKMRSSNPLPSIKALPPIGSGGGDELAEKKRQTEVALQRSQEQLAEQRRKEGALRAQLNGVDPVEAERRAQHMREQRDLLVAKKRLEREAKVRLEEERKAKQDADHDQLSAAVDQIRGKYDQASKASGDSYGGADEVDTAELRRSSLRNALARRMKNDLIESEEAKYSQLQESQFSELDKKLQQVEQLREDNRKRDYILSKELERKQAQIARNVRISAANLPQGGERDI